MGTPSPGLIPEGPSDPTLAMAMGAKKGPARKEKRERYTKGKETLTDRHALPQIYMFKSQLPGSQNVTIFGDKIFKEGFES